MDTSHALAPPELAVPLPGLHSRLLLCTSKRLGLLGAEGGREGWTCGQGTQQWMTKTKRSCCSATSKRDSITVQRLWYHAAQVAGQRAALRAWLSRMVFLM